VVSELPASADKRERQTWKRRVRRAYFDTLKPLAGLFTHRHVELKVLQRGKFLSSTSRGLRWADYLVCSQSWRYRPAKTVKRVGLMGTTGRTAYFPPGDRLECVRSSVVWCGGSARG